MQCLHKECSSDPLAPTSGSTCVTTQILATWTTWKRVLFCSVSTLVRCRIMKNKSLIYCFIQQDIVLLRTPCVDIPVMVMNYRNIQRGIPTSDLCDGSLGRANYSYLTLYESLASALSPCLCACAIKTVLKPTTVFIPISCSVFHHSRQSNKQIKS